MYIGVKIVDAEPMDRDTFEAKHGRNVGGDKTGEWNAFYEWAIPVADDLYDEYPVELRDEGLI